MAEIGDLGQAAGRSFAEEVNELNGLPDGWVETIMAKSKLPVRIIDKGRVFIGDEEIMLPVIADSVEVSRQGRRNVLHLSIIVGEVTMEGPGS